MDLSDVLRIECVTECFTECVTGTPQQIRQTHAGVVSEQQTLFLSVAWSCPSPPFIALVLALQSPLCVGIIAI